MRLEIKGDVADAQRRIDESVRDGWRVEVINGEVEVTPGAGWWHNAVAAELGIFLRSRVEGMGVIHDTDVSIRADGQIREPYWRPDLVVFAHRTADRNRGWLIGSEVLLAVEVLSPSNDPVDAYLQDRARNCFEAGIPWMLGVEENRLTWWTGGTQVAHGISWAADLKIEGWSLRYRGMFHFDFEDED